MKYKKYLDPLLAVLAVVALYLFLDFVGIGCPIKFVTGIPCAGCGMTRAWFSLMRGDISGAFYYHPLFALPVVFIVVWILRKKEKISSLVYGTILVIGVLIFIAAYIIRLFIPDAVVEIDIRNGLIGHILK
ncbi:MAG: DUF2752 domain-containing protein [Clostridiales bacterium]|nr:DUF2752 domain-containing protein [Clostridiales bacterium]